MERRKIIRGDKTLKRSDSQSSSFSIGASSGISPNVKKNNSGFFRHQRSNSNLQPTVNGRATEFSNNRMSSESSSQCSSHEHDEDKLVINSEEDENNGLLGLKTQKKLSQLTPQKPGRKKRGSQFIELPRFGDTSNADSHDSPVRSIISRSSSSNEEDKKENSLTPRQRTITDDLYVRNEKK